MVLLAEDLLADLVCPLGEVNRFAVLPRLEKPTALSLARLASFSSFRCAGVSGGGGSTARTVNE